MIMNALRGFVPAPGEFVWLPGQTPLSDGRCVVAVSSIYVACCCTHNWALGRSGRAVGDKSGAGSGKRRSAQLIKLVAAVHNAALSLFSLAIHVLVGAELFRAVQRDGLFAIACPDPLTGDTLIRGPLMFWCYIFYVSKYYELVDTLLIAAAGKPIIPLHIWHHAIMIPAMWLFLEGSLNMSLIGVSAVNSFVHIIMYAYYFCAAIGVSWGKWKKVVTQIQIAQFCCGVPGPLWFLSMYYRDLRFAPSGWGLTFTQGCAGDHLAIWAGNVLNGSFLLLFTRFFRKTYKKDV